RVELDVAEPDVGLAIHQPGALPVRGLAARAGDPPERARRAGQDHETGGITLHRPGLAADRLPQADPTFCRWLSPHPYPPAAARRAWTAQRKPHSIEQKTPQPRTPKVPRKRRETTRRTASRRYHCRLSGLQ